MAVKATKGRLSSAGKKTSSEETKASSTETLPKRLYRSENNKIIAGVCGGLAEYFALDATLIRIIFVVLTVFSGAGLLVYLLLWLIIPSESQINVISEETIRQNMYDMRDRARHFTQSFHAGPADSKTFERRRLLGIIIAIIGILFLFNALGLGFDLTRYWPAWLIVVGIALIIFH